MKTHRKINEYLNAVREDHTHFLQIPDNQTLSEHELEALLTVNGLVLQFIEKPSQQLISAAIYQNPFAIKHVPKPTKAEQLIAVEQEPIVIKHIPLLDDAIAIKAVSLFSNAIYCLEQPSDSVKVLAIIKNKAHKHFKNEVEHGVLATTYGFLSRNKMNLSRCLGANESFDSLEELALITHQIRNTLVATYPLLNEVLV